MGGVVSYSYSEEVADGVVDDGGEEGDQDGQKSGFVILWLLAVGEDEAEADEDRAVYLHPCAYARQDQEGHVGLQHQTQQKTHKQSAVHENGEFPVGLGVDASLCEQIA